VHRRAYVLLIGIAALMGTLAVLTAVSLDKRVVDPDGFLGPSWMRLPILLAFAFAIDVGPLAVWMSRRDGIHLKAAAEHRIRTHWTRERIRLVVMALVCFYLTYVSYRNLKSFLPEVTDASYDRPLHQLDQFLFFGHEPAVVLHQILGEHFVAHVLSTVYLWFLPLVPLIVLVWSVWSRNISFGYWMATAQCLAWSLGTASYYALPTLGPGFEYSWLYTDLANTGSSSLMDSLSYGRHNVIYGVAQDSVQSVAGFASLHCAITLLVALMIQYTIDNRALRIGLWVNFAVTVVATLYFGWHYIADDIAGCLIAVVSFYVGGLASGQKFDRHGLASHPTTTTSMVPVADR
jgi:hypothetical protein